MDNVSLNSFLKFGYFLDYDNPNYYLDLSHVDKNKYVNYSEEELVDLGIKKFKNAIRKQFNLNEKHLVPLSGGLDSRAILAALLELTEAKNIHTYTFGTPNTQDYEIGKYIANKIGTNHICFSLIEYKYNIDELLDISKRIDYQTVLFHHPPIWEVGRLYKNFSVWSGAIIDHLFGKHTHKKKGHSLYEAKKNYINENIYVKSIDLTNIPDESFFDYITYDENFVSDDIVFEHALDLMNKQLKFIAPHILIKGFNYKTIFNDKDLVNFALSINDSYLRNQFLYKKMLTKAFPKLFSENTTSNYGLALDANKMKLFCRKVSIVLKRLSNRIKYFFPEIRLDYIDFNEGIRNREDLKKIIYENVIDLEKRRIVDWIDIKSIWKRHMNKQRNHADALLVLASLEIHMKAKNLR